ncbi:hypothetical protein EI555_021164, partial [Monodon monoceros]
RSCAVSPTGCDAAEPVAGKALDLINKGRWDGYLFQLLWNLTVQSYPGNTGLTVSQAVSIRPSEIVIGQCKVIAITLLDGSQNLRVNDFNCTTSSDTDNSGLHAEGWAKGKIFGFCRADLSYDVEDSDLETPKDIVINYDVFNLK